MKVRGFLILALAMTVAGVASASVFTPARDSAPRDPSLALPAPVAKPAVERRTASVVPPSVARKPAIEVRQAPVPLLMKARPPVDLPAVNAAADTAAVAGPTAAADPTAKAGDEAGVKLAENSAKSAIEADGYKGVRVVRQGANGIWHARALRGSTEVTLTVDGQGHVTAD